MPVNQSADAPGQLGRVFLSYAHADAVWRQRLRQHLEPLERQGVVFWDDSRLELGSHWQHEIQRRMDESQVVLLLISPSSVTSDFVRAECVRAMDRHNAGEAFVIPLLIAPVDLKAHPARELMLFPENAKAIALWRHPEEALAQLPQAILNALAKAPAKRRKRGVLLMPPPPSGVEIEETVRQAARDAGLDLTSLEGSGAQPGGPVYSDPIKSSDLIIADLTAANPNVMYELGYAQALRKPTILLRSEKDEKAIPSNLVGQLYLVYDPSNPAALRMELAGAIDRRLGA